MTFLNKILFLLCLLVFGFKIGNAKTLSVSILAKNKISSADIVVERGVYTLTFKGENYSFKKGDKLHVTKGLLINIGDSVKFNTDQLFLKGNDYVNHFSIRFGGSKYKYDDDLRLINDPAVIKFVNDVDLDHYVAGVVEGEAGYNLPLEYYKLQAILCRTYGLKNISRHTKEGFNLCDEVHCQVYHKKCTKNDIIQGTSATSGLVVVDDDLNLINTTFHSNCGGQTCNSEDVWISKLDYLRSVKDSFCTSQPHARWKKSISIEKFDSIFLKNGQLDSLELKSVYKFCQDTLRYPYKKLIFSKLTKMRSDFGLNSTYFSMEKEEDKIVFYGRGFGHGVGLCQEGGITMTRLGYSYVDVLKYYYSSIHIVNQQALLFFKED
jgi:stage II sporulation protein D